MPLTLRPYQSAARAALEAATARGVTRPLIAWATGTGKTVLFASWLQGRPGRALIIAHRDELLQQAREKMLMVNPRAHVGIVRAEHDEADAPTVIASIQTLSRDERLSRCLAAGVFDTCVIDEAHHSEAPTYRHLTRVLSAAGTQVILGVTATPARGDKRPLGRTWQEIVHTLSILDGIKLGYLVNLRCERVRVEADFTKLRSSHGDIIESEAEKVLSDAKAPQAIADAIHRFCVVERRPTLVFTAGVSLAHETARACRGVGFDAEAVDGTTPQEDRSALLARFRSGETQVVVNCGVLTEGYDEPSIACVVVARPTLSQPFYAQMVGRGTRVFPGKKDCLILDLVGNSMRHDLVTLPALFGPEISDEARARVARGAGVEQAMAEDATNGKVRSERVSLFATRDFAWVRSSAGFALSLGRESGMLFLRESPEGWAVLRRVDRLEECVWVGASLEYAQGVAEDVVRREGAAGLARRSAPWRRDRISVGQMSALQRFGVPWDKQMTKGEAADLLTRAIAGKAPR